MSYETFMQVESLLWGTQWNRRFSHVMRVRLPERSWLGAQMAARVPIRGLPQGYATLSLAEDCVQIHDEAAALDVSDTCTKADAIQAVTSGVSYYVHGKSAITHPDFHSYTWLAPSEFRELLTDPSIPPLEHVILRATDAALETFTAAGHESRLILWRLN